MIFLGTDMRLTGLRFLDVLLAFSEMGMVFAFLQLLGIFPDLHKLSNMIESSLARTTAISPGTLGCTLVGPMQGRFSQANTDFILIHCLLFSSFNPFSKHRDLEDLLGKD